MRFCRRRGAAFTRNRLLEAVAAVERCEVWCRSQRRRPAPAARTKPPWHRAAPGRRHTSARTATASNGLDPPPWPPRLRPPRLRHHAPRRLCRGRRARQRHPPAPPCRRCRRCRQSTAATAPRPAWWLPRQAPRWPLAPPMPARRLAPSMTCTTALPCLPHRLWTRRLRGSDTRRATSLRETTYCRTRRRYGLPPPFPPLPAVTWYLRCCQSLRHLPD